MGAFVFLAGLVIAPATPGNAWPPTVYRGIFEHAGETLPPPLRGLLSDLEPVLHRPCVAAELDVAVRRAIAAFRDPQGSPTESVASLRDAGCAAAALNDPGMNALVADQVSRFAVVFYGWNPVIQGGDVAGYIELRQAENARLNERFRQTSRLPNRSDLVELSPEFGMAAIAYSHAVTDVANVWLYIWTAVNGAF